MATRHDLAQSVVHVIKVGRGAYVYTALARTKEELAALPAHKTRAAAKRAAYAAGYRYAAGIESVGTAAAYVDMRDEFPELREQHEAALEERRENQRV